MKKIIYSALIFSGLFLNSCTEKDLEPTLTVNKDANVVSNVGDLKGLLGGAYDRMTSATYYGRNVIVFGDVRSDNTYASGNSGRFVTSGAMDMTNSNGDADDAFLQMYGVLANCNIIINANISGDQVAIDFVKGQALALRALVHYDLVRIYGQQNVGTGGLTALGVAYVTQFLAPTEMKPKRNTVGEVKGFIYDDLDKALAMMSPSLNGDKKAIRTFTVNAIKARVALYFGDWQIAKTASQAVITGSGARVLTSSE